MSGVWTRVARADEIREGEVRVFQVGGESVAVCNVGGTFHAIEDLCTHDDGPLGEGRLEEHCIECPRHGARFDVRTGEVLRMPAASPVRTFATKIEGGDVYVAVGEV